MYNRHYHEKIENKKLFLERLDKKQEKQLNHLRKRNHQFTLNYRKRVDTFLQQVSQHPYPLAKTDRPYKYRDEHRDKFLAGPIMRINGNLFKLGHPSERSRLEETI